MKKRKLKTRSKKYALMATLMTATLFLSGCMRFDLDTGAPQGFFSSLIHDFLIVPLEYALDFLGGTFGNYAIAIIVFTIIFRLILLPLTLRQQKGMIESQTKMGKIQPVVSEIQEEMKQADDPTEKQALNMELMQVYKENDVSLTGQLSSGCLPLLLQMPIFIAMIQVMRRSTALNNASLFGISLGERSILLAVLTAAIYFLQSKVMISAMPEEQQKTAGATMYVSPVMMLVIGISSPAGIALYWLISGVFTFLQQLFNTYYYKPKIEEKVQEEMGDIEVVERKRKPRRDVSPDEDGNDQNSNNEQNNNNRNRNRNRNAGRQQRNQKN
ncbi:MAG: membrane protein insertase YidC [Atopostipes suicloacalis]|nr:membrane protein insertase YidC [Atopostipes suicloacalis]MDN6730750.1 membrane protein insertase YidC [Atopostipes suicloacalis]